MYEEDWSFVNIDKQLELYNIKGSELQQWLSNGTAKQLVFLLQRPKYVPFKATRDSIRISKSKSMASPLISLPQNIIDRIVTRVTADDANEDLLCLAMACTYFFRLLGSRLQAFIRRCDAPWSGDRLIFVGNYATGYPKGIATSPAEERAWDGLGENPLMKLPKAFSRDVSTSRGRRILVTEIPRRLSQQCRDGLEDDDPSLGRAARLLNILRQVRENPRESDLRKEPVLRNLTTKEYVFGFALTISGCKYRLAELTLMYTSWTDGDWGTEGLGGKGKWAGHRLDLTTVEDVEVECGEWRDVSAQAIVDMMRLT